MQKFCSGCRCTGGNLMKQKVYTRDVLLIMVAAFFYMFCSMFAAPIVAGYAQSIGASGVIMGLVSALTTGIAVVFFQFLHSFSTFPGFYFL